MAIIVYKGNIKPNSWLRYFHKRIYRKKSSNLILFCGGIGTGKSLSAVSIGEMFSKLNKVPFTIDNVGFHPKDLLDFVHTKKNIIGQTFILDEPQVTLPAREFQSRINKVFGYFFSTIRFKRINIFLVLPYDDMLDKNVRKVFTAKFTTQKINPNRQVCRIVPKRLQYNSQKSKFYEPFLKVSFKPPDKTKNVIRKLKWWDIPRPSKELEELYEQKKLKFSKNLYKDITEDLGKVEKGKIKRQKVVCVHCNYGYYPRGDTESLKCPRCYKNPY